MKKYYNYPLINLKKETYLTLIIFLAPFANFLSGTNLDIYSPSMPAIAAYFHANIITIKNTIGVALLGWSLGAITFGILIDSIGRKKVLLIGVFIYVITSFLAPFSASIHELMLARFIQGFCIASISTGCRVMVADLVTGKRFLIAMLYTSIGYGLGPIISPFVGGFLQHYFGWKANFIALTVLSSIIFLALFIFVNESIPVRQPLRLKSTLTRCFSVLSHLKFMSGVTLGGIGQIQIMIYPTLGPFIVERLLHQNVLVYGNSALMVGACYLTGSLFTRALLKFFLPQFICDAGYCLAIIGMGMAYFLARFASLDLTTVMLPIGLICVSTGMIFPSVLGSNLKHFLHTAGIAMAIQVSGIMLISGLGIFLISRIHVNSLDQLANIYFWLVLLQGLVFYFFYRATFLEVE